MKITEAVSIALHAATLIAINHGQTTSARTIAERFNLSNAHLSKVMQRLSRSGLVSSSRGPSGGFRLARPADQIKLLDIYEAVEGNFQTEQCLLEPEVCEGGFCVLGQAVARVNQEMRDVFSQTSLSQVAACYQAPNAVVPNIRLANS